MTNMKNKPLTEVIQGLKLLDKPYRVCKSDFQLLTADYRSDRVNLVVDKDDIVTAYYYG